MKTRSDVVQRATRELGLAPSAQTAEPSRFLIVQDVFDDVLAELQANEIAAWGRDETPDECVGWMSVVIAQRAAHRVGADTETVRRLSDLGEMPYRKLIAVAGRRWRSQSFTSADRF